MSTPLISADKFPFGEGDLVTKVGGDYTFLGPVLARFTRIDGQVRYVCEDDRGILHIFGKKALKKIGYAYDLDVFCAKVAAGKSHPFGFSYRQLVEKIGGDYTWQGEVRCAFRKLSGKDRYIVENTDGILHVFGPTGLKSIVQNIRAQNDQAVDKLLDNIFDGKVFNDFTEDEVIAAGQKALVIWQETFAGLLNIPLDTLMGKETTDGK